MTWYPYPISFLDWWEDMRHKRREEGMTAAKCKDSWPDIAWSGNAERERGGDDAEEERNEASSFSDFIAESKRPAVGEASSAGGADGDGERRGAAEMTPAVPPKSSKRSQTFVTAVPVADALTDEISKGKDDDEDKNAKLKAARSNDTFATALMGGDAATTNDGKNDSEVKKAKLTAASSNDTFATALMAGDAATLRAALSTETFATAREFNALTMSPTLMSPAGLEEVQGGSADKSADSRRVSKVKFGEERMVVGEDAVTDGDATRRSAVAAHHWPSGQTRHL
ncbi:hypothetical protein LTR85_011001 [Meristemomyces frigidus]|nr:hypothetical protein LTR85_011001 [Meristemomyces frigidus]